MAELLEYERFRVFCFAKRVVSPDGQLDNIVITIRDMSQEFRIGLFRRCSASVSCPRVNLGCAKMPLDSCHAGW